MALSALVCLSASAKNALIVVAHGSPMPFWNNKVMAIEEGVKKELAAQGVTKYDYVRVAMMEFTTPTIADVIRDCEKEGVDHIYMQPLFIAPSSHSEQDIPNILGMKYNKNTVSDLVEEGTELVNTNIPIVLGPVMSTDSILSVAMIKSVEQMSKDKDSEGVVLVAHGDYNYNGFWHNMLRKIGADIEGATGIKYLGGTFVGMGQRFKEDISKTVCEASKTKKRVLMVGVYLASGMKEFAMMTKMLSPDGKMLVEGAEADVIPSEYGILPASQDEVCKWIVEKAVECDRIK